MLFGWNLREFVPFPHENLKQCAEWYILREDREKAFAKRSLLNTEKLTMGSKQLRLLAVGDTVCVQNMSGPYPKRWDTTRVVVEV